MKLRLARVIPWSDVEALTVERPDLLQKVGREKTGPDLRVRAREWGRRGARCGRAPVTGGHRGVGPSGISLASAPHAEPSGLGRFQTKRSSPMRAPIGMGTPMVTTERIDALRGFMERGCSQYEAEPANLRVDGVIRRVFQEKRANRNPEDVLHKVALLNSLYRTGVIDFDRMADHILTLDLDSLLLSGSADAVERVRKGHGIRKGGKTEIDFYSFATKYCHWHEPKKYVIYDSWVDECVPWLCCELELGKGLRGGALKKYEVLVDRVDAIREALDMPWDDYKRIDQAFWQGGKALWEQATPELNAMARNLGARTECLPRKLRGRIGNAEP